MLQNHIAALQDLLQKFLNGTMARSEFVTLLKPTLALYEELIDERPCWPLPDLCDGSSISDADFKKYCRQAYGRLPREQFDRETRAWIQSELVDGATFRFAAPDGASRFGASEILYASVIDDASFLLSALNGTLKPLPFPYAGLLTALRETGGEELAAWVFCSESDSQLPCIGTIWSLGNVYEEDDQLALLEQTRGDSVQWGNCYLLLLPKNKSWALVHYYHFDGFEIALHGAPAFVHAVRQSLFPSAPRAIAA